ncbi:MlaD family protein [Nocardia cerradoensis]|nr:MlaD family protein [Nocardia cerradoensis]
MADAVGLYVGNPVTQMGYKVGRVEEVRPEGDHVRVRFSLESGRNYPAGVKAVTRSKTILADRTLELVGNYESGPELRPGRCISLQDTATPKSMSEITGSASDFIDHVAPADGTQPVEKAVDGLARSLAGNGEPARQLMEHAAQALSSPDRMVSDIGTILQSSAPLTTDALARWSNIHHVLDMMPTTLTSITYGLWPGVNDMINGLGPLIAAIYEIQTQYGSDIWPAADQLAQVIHVAATKAPDIQHFLEVVPPIAAFLTRTAAGEGAIQYRPPTVTVRMPDAAASCAALNQARAGSCVPDAAGAQTVGVGLLDLVVAEVGK